MDTIGLNDFEILEAKIMARQLHEYWSQFKHSNLEQIISGMYAEIAVVKYFNQVLGATPAVIYNREYVNGGDGGFDFECCGIKFDVKNDNSEEIKTEYALNTMADAIIGTTRLSEATNRHTYVIFGFIPVTRINPAKPTLALADFADLTMLARERRNVFKGKIPERNCGNQPMRIGSVLQLAVETLR